MTNEPALTVDSLHTFKYKKRFSFCNRNVESEDNGEATAEAANDEDLLLDGSKNLDDNDVDTGKSPKKASATLKGSAKLKSDPVANSDNDGSDSDNSEPKTKKKKKVQRK
jgi:hypothetical protein